MVFSVGKPLDASNVMQIDYLTCPKLIKSGIHWFKRRFMQISVEHESCSGTMAICKSSCSTWMEVRRTRSKIDI